MTSDTAWWRGATIYQIYPRSFFDSNGDGVGDLPGVTGKLDYVAYLGVDGIWLSPFFTSPMADFGYDVSDYRNVDPIFGTLADFDALIVRAHALGLKVVIDQVYCHTSNRHPWFCDSQYSKTGAYADWYVWADPKPDGTAPNNWLSLFGGPAWSWDGRRRQYYLHHFLKEQPTLNLHNPDVIDALVDVGRFWIGRGVDGFRLDALNVGMQDQRLRDNPPADNNTGAAKPYEMQKPVHTLSQNEMIKVVEKFSVAFRKAGGKEFFTVAEVVGKDPHALMVDYTTGDKALSAAYCFDFIGAEKASAALVKKAVGAWGGADNTGYPAWALSNHDCRRIATRWRIADNHNANVRLFALLHAAFRGPTFIYQGEELGLPQADIAFEDLVDPEGVANWPASQGRDGARTPMPWRTSERNAGFSIGFPWLPIDAAHPALAVEKQEADVNSTLSFFKNVIALRRDVMALRYGSLEVLNAPDHIVAVRRKYRDEKWICVYNLSDQETSWRPDSHADYDIVLHTGDCTTNASPPETIMPLTGYVATLRR